MGGQAGFFDLEERLALLSALSALPPSRRGIGQSPMGDGLERLSAVVDFEFFRPGLERAVPRADRSQGGRPPFDHVLVFEVLVLQTQNNPSDERPEFYLRDRLTPPLSPDARWIRFLGPGLGDPVPDAMIRQQTDHPSPARDAAMICQQADHPSPPRSGQKTRAGRRWRHDLDVPRGADQGQGGRAAV